MPSNRERGGVLLTMVVLIAIVSAAVSAFYSSNLPRLSTATSFVKQKQAFYNAESARFLAAQTAQDYLQANTPPTSSGVNDAITKALSAAMPPIGFKLVSSNAQITSTSKAAAITTGPFTGMIAPQTGINVKYQIASKKNDDFENVVSTEVDLTLAQVGLFQFMYFVDLDFADFVPGPTAKYDGRIHVNGTLCVAGQTGVTFNKLTAAEHIYHANHYGTSPSGCTWRGDGPNTHIQTGVGVSTVDIHSSSPANDSSCTNCDGTGLSWKDYALATWNGNVQDKAHGVPVLKLPIPANIQTQVGADGDSWWIGKKNDHNLRFLVDPINKYDTDASSKYKFARNADIRILEGVWYLKNPADSSEWPGKPIWSDHPGSFTDKFGKHVGQADLGLAAQTTLFSYYEYDSAAATLTADKQGVISYGTLFRDTSTPGITKWYPGHRMEGNIYGTDYTGTAPAKKFQTCNHICSAPGVVSDDHLISSAVYSGGKCPNKVVSALDSNQQCKISGPLPLATQLLNATRSGFLDGHIAQNIKFSMDSTQTEAIYQAKIQPINFDLEQFATALKSKSPGELGSYFGSGGYMKRDFNGIVYISSYWNGSEDGLDNQTSLVPKPWPNHGSSSLIPDADEIESTGQTVGGTQNYGNSMERILPYPLCSDTLGGQPFDKSGTLSRFKILSCSKYKNEGFNIATFASNPNAVRLINGYSLDPTYFTQGLSIVSNLPVYVQGSYNTMYPITSGHWMPALVAGDNLTFHSDGWDDSNALWSKNMRYQSRIAVDTTYNMTAITGWTRNRGGYNESIPLHANPAMAEDWSYNSAELTYNGAMVIGYYPVYWRGGRGYFEQSNHVVITYAAGKRTISFDPHLNTPDNQPPGAPLFFIHSTNNWKTQ